MSATRKKSARKKPAQYMSDNDKLNMIGSAATKISRLEEDLATCESENAELQAERDRLVNRNHTLEAARKEDEQLIVELRQENATLLAHQIAKPTLITKYGEFILTAECRKPAMGEWFIGPGGHIIKNPIQCMYFEKYRILERIAEPEKPKVVRWQRTGEFEIPKPGEWFERVDPGETCGRPMLQDESRFIREQHWILKRIED